MIRYFIPTHNRPSVEMQPAYMQLERAGLEPTLVLSANDKDIYAYAEYRWIQSTARTLPKKREWIAKYAVSGGLRLRKFAMFDDDTQIRETRADGSFVIANGASMRRMDAFVEKLLDHYAHGAAQRQYMIGPLIRGGAWPYAPNRGRYGQVMFYNCTLWSKVPRFYIGSTVSLCDLCSQLDLMKQGLPFFRLTKWYASEIRAKGWRTTGMGASGHRDQMVADGAAIEKHFEMRQYMSVNRRINMPRLCAAWGVPNWLGAKPPSSLPARYRAVPVATKR